GFVVETSEVEQRDLRQFFRDVRESTDTLKVTVLTTLQCNFACDYCIQGDHGDYNKFAAKMSMETAARVGDWIERRVDAIAPGRLVLTFFGGEPLLNLPVLDYLAARLHGAAADRGVELLINIITNGLLLSRELGSDGKPLNGACMTSAGTGVSRVCDSCNFVDDKMAFLRDETRKHGFATADGVHMGPCEIHRSHAHTIGPDGSLFACPGFAGEALQSTGHIDDRQEDYRTQALRNFERLAAWEQCHDCAFIPVCAGGCTVAALYEH